MSTTIRSPALPVLALLLGAMALTACEVRTTDATPPGAAASTGPPAPAQRPASRSPEDAARASQSIGETRVTAVVRAAERVAPSVVTISVIRTQRSGGRSMFESFFLPPTRRVPGLGSGFIIDAEGHILTNDHVIRDAEQVLVTLPDGRDLEARLIGTDPTTDVAVLKVEGSDLPTAPLGTSEGLMIGEWTIAIGNPFGNLLSNSEPTVTVGVVSATGRHIVPGEGDRGLYLGMVQTDAPINPGNSGGPLVNALGEVVGVNSSIFTRSGGSEGLGFAIPIDRALRVAEDLIADGEIRRAWLGLEVDAVEADAFSRTRGVMISAVFGGSPAADAGLRAGDHILSAGGRRMATTLDFESLLLDLREGDALVLELEGRAGPATIRAEALPSTAASRVEILDELQAVTLTPPIRAEYGVQAESGALIVEISEALGASLGLRTGDVILQINNAPVRSAEEAARALEASQRSGRVLLVFERADQVTYRRFYWRR